MPTRHFRVIQMFCILTVASCVRVAMKVSGTSPEITRFQWVVIALGLWAIPSGFLLQRQIVGHSDKPGRRSTRFTPLTRWSVGNLTRLATANSVALWGVVLREIGGPAWLTYFFFAMGGLLLLVWKPGASPQQFKRTPSAIGCAAFVGGRNIATTLIGPVFGEQTAQACDNA